MSGTFQVSAFAYDGVGSNDALQLIADIGDLQQPKETFRLSQPAHCGSSGFELHSND
jgi:hypothetical protein